MKGITEELLSKLNAYPCPGGLQCPKCSGIMTHRTTNKGVMVMARCPCGVRYDMKGEKPKRPLNFESWGFT